MNMLAEIEDKITFAESLYANRDGDIAEVEEVYKAEFTTDKDVEDVALAIVNLPTGQSQIKIHKAYLSLGLDVSIAVLPFQETEREEALCTKLERYLAAVQWENEMHTYRRAYSDFIWFFLVRGAGVFKTLFYPEYVGTPRFPIRILARDYRYVYPVFGDTDLLYVVEKYNRYAGDLRRELSALWEKKRDKETVVWRPPALGEYSDTEEVEVVEYWDDVLKGLRVGGSWVWLLPHHYTAGDEGIIPYSFAWCERAPLPDGKWMARSLLAPIKELIKQQSILMSKTATATELFYYPQILVETPHGEAFVMSSAPGQARPVPVGSKVTVLNPTPNQLLVTTLMGWYEKGISLFGLPEVMWGIQPGQVQAGYALSLLQSGAKTKIIEKAAEIEAALAQTFGHVLQLTEAFAPLAKDGLKIYPAGKQRGTQMVITAADVAGHYRVRVGIAPEVPTDQALQWRIAGMARQPHPVTKLPVVSDAYIREEIVGVRHPDVEQDRILQEFLATHPQVQEAQAKLFVHQWMEEHAKELRALERAEERETKRAMKELEQKVLAAYREAVARGEVPPGLMPTPRLPPEAAGLPPKAAGLPPEAVGLPPKAAGLPPEAVGLPPEVLPPSFVGRGPETALPEELPMGAIEQIIRGGQ